MFCREFRSIVKQNLRVQSDTSAEVDRKVHRDFPQWFTRRILNDNLQHLYHPDFIALASGPLDHARRFTAYNVNGFKFRTVFRDGNHSTQNSGVFGTYGGIPYYGRLVDIIEVNYRCIFPVILFKCLWTNPSGVKKDVLGITSVNFSRLVHTIQSGDDEPYILASEAQQVYYIADEKRMGWHMVVHLKPRALYDMGVVE